MMLEYNIQSNFDFEKNWKFEVGFMKYVDFDFKSSIRTIILMIMVLVEV